MLRLSLVILASVALASCGSLEGGRSSGYGQPSAMQQLNICLASVPPYPHNTGSFSSSSGVGAGCEGTSGTSDSQHKVFAFYSKELNKGKWTTTWAGSQRTGLIYFASRADPTFGGWVFVEKQPGGTRIDYMMATDCPCGPPPSQS